MRNARSWAGVLVAILVFTPFRGAKGDIATTPNVVVLLADDLGYGDLGCYGHPRIKSPRLDKLASEGLRFTQCYSACGVCSPSRSAILTGRTPYRNGVYRWIPEGHRVHLRTSEITVAKLLKERGYDTCHVGKWHLNGKFNNPEQPQPNDHGFDHWFSTQNNAAPSHMNPVNFVRNGKPVGKLEGVSAVLVAQEAIGWLKQRPDPKKPFFLAMWTHEPHLPIETAAEFLEPYSDLPDEGLRQHHGNVTQMDHAYGLLLAALDEMGYRDKTFVVFTSDNGPEGDGLTQRNRGSTGGLRGRKRHSYEGGIRVPGIVRWPGRVKPGSETSVPVIGSDIFSTVCEITGAPVPADRPIDGVSWVPLFEGKPVERKQPLYWRNHLAPSQSRIALRSGDWKIIGSADLKHFELYNIANEPTESVELSTQHPAKLEEMRKLLTDQNAAVLAEGPDWWQGDEEK